MLQAAIWPVVAAGLAAALVNLAGIYLFRYKVAWTRKYSKGIMALAAGIIIGTALLHFIPELAFHTPHMTPWIAASFFGLYVVEHHFAPHFHVTPVEESHALRPEVGIITAVGFAFHAVFDGLAIGVGFAFGGDLGLVAAIAVIAHEIPEGMATFTALLHSGHGTRRATSISVIIALITPVVAITSFLLLAGMTTTTLGLFMALATGSLLYIGATDLLPEAAHAGGWQKTALIAAGFLVALVIALLGHSHGM